MPLGLFFVKSIQLLCMTSCKFLPFGIHIRSVVYKLASPSSSSLGRVDASITLLSLVRQFIVLKGTLSEAKLLYKPVHLVIGEYLLQLFVGQLLRVVL